jgi:class 3 adenylate cyclase/tetratricopeptide (TPR) repeat protein
MSEERPTARPVDDLTSVDRAIAALESQRATLGDEVVETALQPLRERRRALAARQAGEQRKLVTVLFADLVDFTVLSGRLDAEDTRAVVGAYFVRWQELITDQGGTVEKFIGDAVMAVFGLYRSSEDDAQRAIRAALAMTRELGSLNEELEGRYGVALQMRVGIDTGDVVISTLEERAGHEFVAVGPTVNRASRLQSVAPPGGVLISADTHRQVRGRFSMEPRPGLVLKGVDEPVDGFIVVSERPHGFRLDQARGVEGVDTATVGRTAELRRLQDHLLDVVEDQRWQVTTIVGDAGVGKSRLLLEFDSWLGERPEPVRWFRGRASQASSTRPHALLQDVMASRFMVQESDSPTVVRRKFDEGFRAALGETDQASASAQVVADWLGYDLEDGADRPVLEPQSLRDEASTALAEYFAALSRTTPVVILLEDIHWADDASLRWLDAADRVLHDCQVHVVATARPTLLEDRPHWGEGLAHHSRLNLEPLSRRESRELLGQILRRVESPPESLVALVIDTAEGNPFYIEELVTWLVDAGVIVRGDDVWHVVEQLVETVVVPSTLRGILQARLDSLSVAERTVLQRASVVGRVFWDEAVANLDTSATPREAAQVLEELRRQELVFEREVSTFESAREFLFKHALLRDVAYEGVLRTHRERYHRLAGLWLAGVSERTGRGREYAALIADHFDRARAPEASTWYLQAGLQAASVYALEEAVRLLRRGLELTTDDQLALRFDLLSAREAVLERMGDRSAQDADLAAMTDIVSRAKDDVERRVRLALAQARLAHERSDYDATVELATLIENDARGAGLEEAVVEAGVWKGKALIWQEDVENALTVLTSTRDRARQLAKPSLEGEALRCLAMLASNKGDFEDSLEFAAQAQEAFVRAGNPEGETMALAAQATTQYHLGHLEEARQLFLRLREAWHRAGHRYREAVANGNLGSIAFSQGHLAEARRRTSEALEVTRQLEDVEGSCINLIVLGQVDLAVGRWESARQSFDEALAAAREVSSAALEALLLSHLTVVALESGDGPTALRHARASVARAPDAPSPVDRALCQAVLGHACLASGDLAAAEAAFRASRDEYGSTERPQVVHEPEVGLAEVARRRGDLATAAALVEPLVEAALAPAPLDLIECARPAALLLIVREVLVATGDPRTEAFARAVRAYLLDRASAIGDDDMAAEYLEKGCEAELLRLTDGAKPPAADILAVDGGAG